MPGAMGPAYGYGGRLNRPYYQDYLSGAIEQAPRAAEQARQYYDIIQGQAPPGMTGTAMGALTGGLNFMAAEGGMPQQQYDESRRQIGQGLGQALGRANATGARAGFWNRRGAQAGAQPAYAGYANALANLEGQRAQMRQQAMGQVLQAGTSLAPLAAREMEAGQRAYGQILQRGMRRGPGWSAPRAGRAVPMGMFMGG